MQPSEVVPSVPSVAAPIPAASAPNALDQRFAELIARVRELRPNDDLTIIEKAYRVASEAHAKQFRASGDPYISHPLEVASILADMQMDNVCLLTGLLHDTVEDTGLTVDYLRREFGDEVARCVDGVTKLSKLKLYSREDRQAESVRKMLLAMVTDIRVVIVKMADRLHNMRTLASLPRDRQERIAQETIEIYSPIAHRLGMGRFAANLRTCRFATWSRRPGPSWPARSNRAAPRTRNSSRHSARCGNESRARRHSGARRGPGEARLVGLPEAEAPEDLSRPGLRSAGPAHRHGFGEELLCCARRHPQRVASHSRPDQGFHRHPAPQSVSVPAHIRDGPGRPRFRGAIEPTKCTASPKMASPRTGSTKRAAKAPAWTISALAGCGSLWNGSARCATLGSSCPP